MKFLINTAQQVFRFGVSFRFLLGLLLLVYTSATAQTYSFKNYSADQGFPSFIFSVHQDQNGFMWFGSNGNGVMKYDGKNISYFTEKDSLCSNYVITVGQRNNTEYVFGTDKGISVWNGREMKNFRKEKGGLTHNYICKVFPDNGKMWVGTKRGLCLYDGKSIKPAGVIQGDSVLLKSFVFDIYKDSKGNLILCTYNNGILFYNGKTVKKIPVLKDDKKVKINCVKEVGNNKYLFGTEYGLLMLENDSLYEYLPGEIKTNTIWNIQKDLAGNVWFTTQTGLYKCKSNLKDFKIFTVKNGLPIASLWDICLDKEGSLWISTQGKGMIQIPGLTFYNYNSKDSLTSDYVTTVALDKAQNKLLVGTYNGVFVFQDGVRRQVLNSNPNKPKDKQHLIMNSVNTIGVKDGKWYFGTEIGLSIYDGKSFRNLDTLDGLKGMKVWSFLDLGDKMVLGTDKGLQYLNSSGKFELPNNDSNLPKEYVWKMVKDKDGLIWMATDNGIIHYNPVNGHFEHYGKSEGFESDYVRSLDIDFKGNLWISTSKALYHFNHGKFTRFSDETELPSYNSIYSVVASANREIYLCHGKGLDKIDLQKFYESGKLSIRSYTKNEGFLGEECNLNASALDATGKLYMGTIKGVTVFDPSKDHINMRPPQTHITKIKLNFEEIDFDKYSDGINPATGLPISLTLPHNENHLHFDFVGISLTNPDKVLYQWKMEGLDKDWSPASDRTEVTYPSLPPGTYSFKVRACNNEGVWNEIPTEFSNIVIKPPFWQTSWFIALCIVVVLASVYAYTSYRTKKLEESKRILEEQVADRTKELREEKEKVELINVEVTKQKGIIEEKNKDITDSINYAKRIQDAVLPAISVICKGFPDSFVFFRPKDIVSGDFYWYTQKGELSFIAAADCTGHGVPGAFMSMIGTNLLNQVVMDQGIVEPGKVLSAVNAGLKNAFSISGHQFDTKDGMDIALCVYNEKSRELWYSGAQRSLYFIRGGVLTEFKPTKNPIGAQTPTDFMFDQQLLALEPGDIIYITSDGYADQFGGPDGRKFMTKRLKEMLVSIHTKEMEDQKNEVEKAILAWMGTEHEQIDDELIIGVRF